MKQTKFFLIFVVLFSLSYWGCSESTDPETNNDAAIAAMAEVDQLIATLTTSEGYNAINEMPDVGLGSPDLNIQLPENFLNTLKKSGLSALNSTSESNPMAIFMYLFFPKGTYTYDDTHWTFDPVPDDEIIFIFPFQNQETGVIQTGKLRYYNMQTTSELITVTMDVYVDNVKLIEITIQLTGSGLLTLLPNQEPVISSISIYGYVVDDSGVQYNFNFTLSETQFIVIAGIDGETPVEITMTGSILDENGTGPESVVITYGMLSVVIDDLLAESGDVGYITYNGNQIGTITIIDGEVFVVWSDGTQALLDLYFPNSNLSSGEFI